MLGLGDYIDAINLSDPRFTMEGLEANYRDHLSHLVQRQADDVISLLKPLAKQHKIIGLALGNHEFASCKHYHYDPMIQICGTLKVKYLGWCAFTRLRITRKVNTKYKSPVYTCIIFTEHSRIAGRLKGGKINSLEARSNDFDADILIRAHSHEKICTTKTRLYMQKEGELKLREKKMVYVICPSYYNAYKEETISYAEMASYPPTSTGVIKIEIQLKPDGLDYHLFQ